MFGQKSPPLGLSLLTIGCLLVTCALGQENPPSPPSAPSSPALTLSRKPPALYSEVLAPLLTPLKTVLDRRGDTPTQDRDGIILLNETLIHTDEAGRRLIVYHLVEEALTESGTEFLNEATYSFRTEDQRMHLVLGQTFQPGGKPLLVEDRAVIMESPQTDAGDSLYGDRGQMRLIFSGVRPGVIREIIVVLEELESRIPGHFSTWENWISYWPTRMSSLIVHMPESVATRVKETRLGAGVVEAEKKTLPSGWVTWTYARERVPPVRSEAMRPPVDQTGPALFLTTLPDWDTFGDWYRGLLKERSTLTPALKKRAQEWTKDAKTQEAKVAAILSHVARDVRYTGLEFGLGAMQPRSPEQVWNTSYGDCKDKSNLAALLLRSLGIEARLTLIQTEHVGRIERRSPDTRHFNHAILAVKTDTGWQFADPTIRYGKPGMLAPSSADREVLIMKEDGIEWSRTPISKPGLVHYHVDASRDTDGSLEGWLELRETEYFEVADQAYYERLNRIELKRDVQSYLSSLLPGSHLIDVEMGKPESGIMWRAFFSQPGQTSGNDEREPQVFPAGGSVMLSMGSDETRETSRYLWPMEWRVTGKITLPEGKTVVDVPAPYDLHTPAYEVEARWEVKDGACLPFYEARVTRALMEPSMHTLAWRGTQSLQNWLQKPLWISLGDQAPATTPAPAAASLGKFPLMPTGEGQLILIEQRYPSGGDYSLRRAALRKALEYFPNDPLTVFMARTRLAMCDWDENKNDEAEKALREILAKPSPKVDEDSLHWARYIYGALLEDQKKFTEAVAVLEPITKKETLTAYRRSWASYQLSLAQEGLKELEPALASARQGLNHQEAETSGLLLQQIAKLLLELKREKELGGDIARVIELHTTQAAPALIQLANAAQAWSKDGHAEWTLATVKALEESKFETPDERFPQALKNAKASVATQVAASSLQKELQTFLEAHPDLDALKAPAQGWPSTVEESVKLYTEADKAVDSDTGHRLALHYLSAFPPDAQFSHYLWHGAAHLESYERQKEIAKPSELLTFMMDLGLRLPKEDETYFEMRFLQGRILEARAQDWKAAAAVYQEILADKAMEESFRSSAIERLANCHEQLKDWSQAATALTQLETLLKFGSSGDGLSRAAQLRLELGDPKEALRLLTLVESNREFLLKNSDQPDTLTEWLDIAKDETKALERWQAKPSWWADWEVLRETLEIKETEVEPLIDDVQSLGAALRQAVQEKNATVAGAIFQRCVHSSRWLPARAVDSAWMCVYQLPSVFPDQRLPMLKFTIRLLSDTLPIDEHETRSRLMYLTVALMDTFSPEEALKRVHEYHQIYPQDEHAISFVMARLWASLAVEMEAEQAPAIARLQQCLTAKEMRSERVAVLSQLCQLLQAQGRGAEIKPLLEQEMKHPYILTNEDELKKVTSLLKDHAAGAELSQAVKRWLSQHTPPWYEHIGPHKLTDEDLEDLQAVLNNNGMQRPLAESAKMYFLTAAEGPQETDVRVTWWAQALNTYLQGQALTPAQVQAAMDAVLSDPDAPEALKDSTLRMACLSCADMDAPDVFKHWRPQLTSRQISPFTLGYLECLDALFGLDIRVPADVAPLIEKQAQKKDPQLLRYLAEALVFRALRHGQMETAQAVSDALGKLRKGSGAEASALQSMRLSIAQTLTGVKRLLPVHEALQTALLKHLEKNPPTSPEKPLEFWGEADLDRLEAPRFRQWMSTAVKTGVYDRRSLEVWRQYAKSCALEEAVLSKPLRQSLITAAMGAVSDDDTCSYVIGVVFNLMDIDNPEERDYLNAAIRPWRDATKMPKTYAEIRSMEAHTALRTGEPLDILSIIPQVKAAGMEQRLRETHLHQVLNQGDVPTLNRALDTLGGDAMLERSNLIHVIPALKKTQRDAELELAVEAGEAALNEAVLSSWTGKNLWSSQIAVKLAEALGRPDLLPEPWLRYVHDAYPEPMHQLSLTADVARLKKDWATALTASEALVKKYPTFYAHHWGRAKALWELNRRAEAADSLRLFVKYCHDEHDHSEAATMLKELEP